MSHVLLMALALTGMGGDWNGTNGLDPDNLLLVPGSLQVEPTPEFVAWFRKDPPGNAELLRYLVRCAVADGHTVTLTLPEGSWSWPGRLGLAEPFPQPVIVGGVDKRVYRILNRPENRTGDVEKWVSACLLAHVNVLGAHMFISIRGNPRHADGQPARPQPSAEERWTQGYPEGVFFGDLFGEPDPAAKTLTSFTVSLNLPTKYDDPTSRWRPPNADLGRTLDFRPETRSSPRQARRVRVAKRFGTYQENRGFFQPSSGPGDPDYPADKVCVAQDKLTTCPDGRPPKGMHVLRPLFLHLPRLANLESVESKPDLGKPFQVLGQPPGKGQLKDCPYETCVGPFVHLWVGGPVGHPAPPGEGRKLVGLKAGQRLEPTLRFVGEKEASGIRLEAAGQPFTAIIRYACPGEACQAPISVQARDGTWHKAGDAWPSTGSSEDYAWLQVGPTSLQKEAPPALRIRIEGGPGPAPELDAVGFLPPDKVPEPQCDGTFVGTQSAEGRYMGICRDP